MWENCHTRGAALREVNGGIPKGRVKAMNLEGFDYTRQKDDDDVDELPDMAHYGSPSLSHRSSLSSASRNNGFRMENGGLKLPPLKKQCSVVIEGAEDGADKEATPNGDSYQHNVKEAENTICMMCKDKFVREGNVDNDLVNFRVFRSGPCTTKDSVTYVFSRPALSWVCLASGQLTRDFPHGAHCRWSTVTSLGSAIEGKHFMKSQGVITFPPGSHMASFNVLIGNDEKWEPIRDFVVRLGDVIEGSAVIGALDHSVCTIVDDDIFPEQVERQPVLESSRPRINHRNPFKRIHIRAAIRGPWLAPHLVQIERPASKPMRRSEKNLPSCIHSDIYLTVDEVNRPSHIAVTHPDRGKEGATVTMGRFAEGDGKWGIKACEGRVPLRYAALCSAREE
jgi:hypothetical protein